MEAMANSERNFAIRPLAGAGAMLAAPRRNLEPFPARSLILRDAPKGRFSEAASKCRH